MKFSEIFNNVLVALLMGAAFIVLLDGLLRGQGDDDGLA